MKKLFPKTTLMSLCFIFLAISCTKQQNNSHLNFTQESTSINKEEIKKNKNQQREDSKTINTEKENLKERLAIATKILFGDIEKDEIVIEIIATNKQSSEKSFFYTKVKKDQLGRFTGHYQYEGFFLMSDGCFHWGVTDVYYNDYAEITIFTPEVVPAPDHQTVCMTVEEFDVFC